MCGILGVVALGESRFNRNNMVAMADAMHHRGPDGDGFFFASESETKPDIPQNRPNTLVWTQKSHREIGSKILGFLGKGQRSLARYVLVFEQNQANYSLRNPHRLQVEFYP